MSSGKNPLVLMMALSVPGAAQALGLGEIHIDSALNERLAAEIDIVGATALELSELKAAVANRDTFIRYGADRPAFLSSMTFKVAQDAQGRPVLAIRSTESFTEPVVNLLVDVSWRSGELVRQYTLLLDPAGFTPVPAASAVPATLRATTPMVEAKEQSAPPAVGSAAVDAAAGPRNTASDEHGVRKTTHLKVGAKATLRGIAWRVGERSESDLQRMMLAIFRANPAAFDGNINRLHRGAVLAIPSFEQLAAISRAEAKREIRAQMAAWRTGARAVATTHPSPVTLAPPAVSESQAAPATTAPPGAVDATSSAATTAGATTAGATAALATPGTDALDRRVQSLEQELSGLKGLLKIEHDQLLSMQQLATRAEQQVKRAEQQAPAAEMLQEQSESKFPAIGAIIAGFAIVAAAFAALYFRLRRRAAALRNARNRESVSLAVAAAAAERDAARAAVLDAARDAIHDTIDDAQHMAQDLRAVQHLAQDPAPDSRADSPQAAADASCASEADVITQPSLEALPALEPAGRSEIAAVPASRAPSQDATVNLHLETVNLRVDPTRLDYNFLDLDQTAQHVQMPSVLNEHAVVKERRTNLADVLKLAIEREPDRQDLRMKLLELYFSAAATNRQAFLEIVQKFARDRDYLPADQWDKIAFMGRQIASGNPLFEEKTAAEDDLADCA